MPASPASPAQASKMHATEDVAVRAVTAFYAPGSPYQRKKAAADAFGVSKAYFGKIEAKMLGSGALRVV